MYSVWPSGKFSRKYNSFWAVALTTPSSLRPCLSLGYLPEPKSSWVSKSWGGNRDGGGAGSEACIESCIREGFECQAKEIRLSSLECHSTPINDIAYLMTSEVTNSKHSWKKIKCAMREITNVWVVGSGRSWSYWIFLACIRVCIFFKYLLLRWH